MEFPQNGKLLEGFFSRILIHIHGERLTCTVGLTNKEIKKVISFSQGKPVSSRSNILSESLGGMLVSKGKINDAQLKVFISELKGHEGERLGELLVSKKVINNVELEDLLKAQILERITDCLFWREGDYKIVDGKLADSERINLDMTIPEIIYHAGLQAGSSPMVKEAVPRQAVPVKAGGASVKIEDLKFSGRELSLYRMINGIISIERILADSKVPEPFVLGFLYSLARMGLVNLRFEKPIEKGSPKDFQGVKDKSPALGTAAQPLSASSLKLLDEIRAKAKDIEGKNYFQYFGLDNGASADQVKTAYFGLAKNYHPDRFPKDFSPEMKREGEKLFSIISEGYNVLIDQKKIGEYIQKLELEAKGITQAPTQIIESELEFQKGLILVKKGDFDGAIELFKRAIALYPEEAEYYISLGFAYFRKCAKTKNNSVLSNAKIEIEKGLSRNDKADKGYLYLGHIAKYENNMEVAREFYAKALDSNPNNLEASSELRLLATRNGKDKKTTGGKGLFGR